MAENTKIQWTWRPRRDGTFTPGYTWNPWRGCEHAKLPDGSPHPGCLNCYADAGSKRNPAVLGEWGPEAEGGTRIKAARNTFLAPMKWNKAAKDAGERRIVFVDSYSDFFEDWKGDIRDSSKRRLWVPREGDLDFFPEMPEYSFAGVRPARMWDLRRAAFDIIDQCDALDFLILTKRPQNIGRFWAPIKIQASGRSPAGFRHTPHRSNVWLIYSASDQGSYDAGIQEILAHTRMSPVLGVSLEPLTGPISLGLEDRIDVSDDAIADRLKWVIVGGESGHDSRPYYSEWAANIIQQCEDFDIPVYHKQCGANVWTRTPWPHVHGDVTKPNHEGDGFGNYQITLNDKKGGDPAEWPIDLRVRQFPKVKAA